MKLRFALLAVAASVVCFALAALWIICPQLILWIWQIDANEAALVMARRGGALFLGLGIILLSMRNAPASPMRRAVEMGFAASCAALAGLGVYDFASGHVGAGIWLAIVIEAAFAAGFGWIAYGGRTRGPAARA
jgi:hypothetical protein